MGKASKGREWKGQILPESLKIHYSQGPAKQLLYGLIELSNKYNSRVTSTTCETQKQQLNSLYNKFGCYIQVLILIFCQKKLIIFVWKFAIFGLKKTCYNCQKHIIFDKTHYI